MSTNTPRPSVPVSELEELLENFIGDGTSGEEYLTRHIQDLIDKAHGTSHLPDLFEVYKSMPESMLWYNGTQQNQAIPQERLDKAAKPLPEGDYKILDGRRDQDTDLVGLKLSPDLLLFIAAKDLKGMPELGGTLQVRHVPLSYTCLPGELYTLEERIELYKAQVGNIRANYVFVNTVESYQHAFLDKYKIPRIKP